MKHGFASKIEQTLDHHPGHQRDAEEKESSDVLVVISEVVSAEEVGQVVSLWIG